MELTFASYNIRKAIGLDRRRDPERILAVLHELDADIVAIQESDRRFGRRVAALPPMMLAEHGWQIAPLAMRPASIGWHGNAILVRDNIDIVEAHQLDLPRLEPRGAARVDLIKDEQRLRVVGMHLDLSGLQRRNQVNAVLSHLDACEGLFPTVMMGDFNEWSRHGGAFREFGRDWLIAEPGRSYPARQPLAQLDRFVMSRDWDMVETRVHNSMLAARASDHLPVIARLALKASH